MQIAPIFRTLFLAAAVSAENMSAEMSEKTAAHRDRDKVEIQAKQNESARPSKLDKESIERLLRAGLKKDQIIVDIMTLFPPKMGIKLMDQKKWHRFVLGGTIYYTISSRDGKAMQEVVFAKERDPDAVAIITFFSNDGKRETAIQVNKKGKVIFSEDLNAPKKIDSPPKK